MILRTSLRRPERRERGGSASRSKRRRPEVYSNDIADAMEADLQPLATSGLVTRISKYDTNPANRPQSPHCPASGATHPRERAECPLLARNGHADRVAQCPLSGAKRKTYARIELLPWLRKNVHDQECAELFSLSSSLSSGSKHFWFSNLRNRDGISTRRLNVGVFTRPRPNSDIVRTFSR
jgi:hypothetical protein